jgi:hypothetical protein
MLRRRISLQHGGDGLPPDVVALAIMSRQQRAELPTHGPDGRPIRYDAYGRVLPDLGARKEEIEALPTREFKAGSMAAEDSSCTICLGEYVEGEMLRTLPCDHVFHAVCIDRWLLSNKKCVLCQQNIDTAQNVKGHTSADEVARGEGTPLRVSAAAVTDGSGSPSPQQMDGLAAINANFADPETVASTPMSAPRIVSEPGAPGPGVMLSLPLSQHAGTGSHNLTPRSSRGRPSSSGSTGERLGSPPSRRPASMQEVTLHGLSGSSVPLHMDAEEVCAPGMVESKEDEEEKQQHQQQLSQQHRPSLSNSSAARSQLARPDSRPDT